MCVIGYRKENQFMKCDFCNAELVAAATVCSQCGELVLQNVEGFKNTKKIQKKLKSIVREYGIETLADSLKFIALVMDYMPEYDKERGLIKNMLEAGILEHLLSDENHDMAIMKAKGYMLQKLFISENAAEFVIVCFTYMFGWPYSSPLREKEFEDIRKEELERAEKNRFNPVNIESKVLTHLEAMKYRLSSNVNVSDGYTKIESFCFDKFNFMRSIRLPSSLLMIGEYAFSECKHLKGVELPDSLRIIKQGAFSHCAKLTVINIPDGVLEIEPNTFSFCSSLEVVEIPMSVGSIGASAFIGCEKLRKLYLPNNIKFIDVDAFAYCPQITIRCYENSYVHKYCLTNGIAVEAVPEGTDLRTRKY